MKAAIINEFGPPDNFIITDIAKPDITNDNDVLIKVIASSVNPVDWKHRKGNHKFILGSPFPIILGYDVSGVVEDIGKSVTKFKEGDEVFCRLNRKYGSAYAEYASAPEGIIALKPKDLSHETAATLPLAASTALYALRDKGKLKPGMKVLINGAASGVGHFAVQLTKELGGICTAVSSQRHEKIMNELKPDFIIDYTKQDFTQQDEKYDLILDIIGNKTFLVCKKILKPGGIYITLLPRPKVLVHKMVALFTNRKKVRTFFVKPNADNLIYLSKLVCENKLKVYIDKTFTLEKIADAHKYSEMKHAEGKISIVID